MTKLDRKHIFLLFVLYGLIIIIISFSLSYVRMKKNIQQDFIVHSTTQLLHHRDFLTEWINHYKKELVVLSHSRFLNNFIKKEAGSKPFAASYLLDMAKAHKNIMQLRYIDNSGYEIIRIDRKRLLSEPIITQHDQLQNKKNRYYFREISRLPQGSIWLSDIDLNIEHGKLQTPYVPTLRIGMPAFIDDKRQGMFIINIFMDDLLEELQVTHSYHLYLVDHEGNFLIHPNKTYNWSKYLNKDIDFNSTFQGDAQGILKTSRYVTETLFTQDILLDQDKRYILIAKLNKETLDEKEYQLIENFFTTALFILLLTFPFAYFIVRHMDALFTRLKVILNNLGNGVFVLDDTERVLYSNKKAQEILEFKASELLGQKFHEKMCHADSEGNLIAKDQCPIYNLKHTRKPYTSDKQTFTTKSGRRINTEFTATPLIINNKFEGSITSFKDITIRKLLEDDLISLTKELKTERNLFVEGPVVAFTWENSETWPVEYVSANVLDIFGFTQAELISGSISYADRIHSDDLERVSNEVAQALEKDMDSFVHKPYRITHKDGSTRWLYDRTVLAKNHSNSVSHFHGFIIDITEQQILQEKLHDSEEKYRHLVENSDSGIFKCSKELVLFYSNKAMLKIFEVESLEALYASNTHEFFLNKRDQTLILANILKNSQINNYEMSIKTLKGNIKHLLINAHYDGTNISGNIIDTTLITQAKEEIQKLSKVIDQIDDLVTITDIQGRIIYANHAFYAFTGYTKDEIIGKTPAIYKSSKHSKAEMKELWETILDKKVYRSIILNKKKDGTLFYEEKTITPMLDEKKNITAFVSTGKDITERINMQEELKVLASTDPLTKLYNRLKFEDLFDAEVERVKRHQRPLSLIMLDIDFFKKINDNYGHAVGDKVLIQLSNLVKSEIRTMDKVARWGGEEFMILVPETDLDAAALLAEKLRHSINTFVFDTVEHISCSFGVVQLKSDETFSSLAQRVDAGLYRAKESGRNRVVTV